jgi:hypothetical protein
MSTRYISWVSLGVAAAFLVVASTAFTLIDIANLELGIGIGIFAVSLLVGYRYRDDVATLATAAGSAIVSAWMIINSTVFSLQEVQSLTLADGLALIALALIGLTAHELAEEQVVQSQTFKAGGGEADHEAAASRLAA